MPQLDLPTGSGGSTQQGAEGRRDERFPVRLPAYVSVPFSSVLGAKGELRNLSARGLMIELLGPPPVKEGGIVRVEWLGTVVMGEVRHITCRPGFVSMGVRIIAVKEGSVLASLPVPYRAEIAPTGETPLSLELSDITEIESRLHAAIPCLKPLAAAIQARDATLLEHSTKVSRYSIALALATGLSASECETIWAAGLLHDLGKIGLSDAALQSIPANPSKIRKETVQAQIETGYRLIACFEELRPVAELVRAHHERWDGTGYPRKLKGADIPRGARIVGIAAAFDALSSGRPQQPPLPVRLAGEALLAESGKRFDPHLVNTFVAALLP